MYVNYEYYKSLYGEKAITEADFNRLYDKAEIVIDNEVSAFGVNKLEVAFPTNEKSAKRVKQCICEIIQKTAEAENAKSVYESASGYVERADGTVVGKVVTSVSAGNESISYSSKSNQSKTWAEKVALGEEKIEDEYQRIIRQYLSGVSDDNGVNLLFGGRYPYRVEKQ